jgi:Putative transposase
MSGGCAVLFYTFLRFVLFYFVFARDSAHNNEQKLMILSRDKFLCRFLLHILPQGFVRIRNFGFLANRRRATLLPLCFHLLGSAQQPQAEQNGSSTKDSSDLWRCPKCAGPMKVIEFP